VGVAALLADRVCKLNHMLPKFVDRVAYHQAEFLLQPIYIRIVDRIRQQSETSTWKVSYEEVQTPQPTNYLCLQAGDRQLRFDLWDLCYQVCFLNYHGSHGELETQVVAIDTNLIDMAAQAPDWHHIDEKAKYVVARVFANL
jgi:hypothetical protein